MYKLKEGETVTFNITVEDPSDLASIVSLSSTLRKRTRTLPYPLEGQFVVTSIPNGWKLTLATFPVPGNYITDAAITLTNGDIRKTGNIEIEVVPSVT
jgi:hypothetical protein